jgi:hypothetical protein
MSINIIQIVCMLEVILTEMFTWVCVNVNNTLYYLMSSTLHFKYSFHLNHINVDIMLVAHTKSNKFQNVHRLTFISHSDGRNI